ncbi:hypothetical protein CLOM_g17455 [Closterium sp. NIES-68]|nr:hypothetical protein CLOM_g17455 [Closterium sp. NIES-68]GJP74881.1 hypothetical protein CLOP_g5409 [Closterium sp. NIES-67]
MAVRGVWQLKRLIVNHCDFSGSSRGAREFVASLLPHFTEGNPQLAVEAVVRRGKHPNLHAEYVNGRERVVDVKNQEAETILIQALRLRNSTGRKVVKLKTRHESARPSIQGMWTPELQAQLRSQAAS